jgi:hypothetical protein
MVRAFTKIHQSKRCTWFRAFFQIAVPEGQLDGYVASRTDPALHEHNRQVMIFNVEAIREHRQRLMEIDTIPRGIATLDNVMQVNVVVSQRAIVHWKSPSTDQIPVVYLIT